MGRHHIGRSDELHRVLATLRVTDGEPGLLYTRKREALGDVETRLKDAFRLALEACKLLQKDETIENPIEVDTREFIFGINNRLVAPNEDETLEDVREGLAQFFNWLFDGQRVEFERDQRKRSRFSVRVRVLGSTSVDTLLKRLGPTPNILN